MKQLGRKFVIVGDFNGRHPNWDDNTQNPNQCGREIENYISNNNNITVATTPGLKTYTDSRSGKTSTIDLTMCSNNLI